MDRATWQEQAFGGQLAGMTLAATGTYREGGGWELYFDPDAPSRTPRLRTWPPHPGYGGSVSLGQFPGTAAVSTWLATGYGHDRRHFHHAFAASAAAGTTRVVVTDIHGAVLELTHAATHPNGRTELFVGGTTELADLAHMEALDADGQLIAQSQLLDRGKLHGR